MVVTRSKKDLGNCGTGGLTEGVVLGRCHTEQQGVPGRHQATVCRVEVVPLNIEIAQEAIERLEHPQEEDNVNIINNRKRRKLKEKYQWSTEKNLRLIEIEEEERGKGRGFMDRLKKRWDKEFPGESFLTAQNLRDKANRVKKSENLMELRRVRQRDDVEIRNVERREGLGEVFDNHADINEEDNVLLEEEVPQERQVEGVIFIEQGPLSEEETNLESYFEEEIKRLPGINEITENARERLGKVEMDDNLNKMANRILKRYLKGKETLIVVLDSVYAMGKAIMRKLGIKGTNGYFRREKVNRRERKKQDRIKELRQWIARISNEINRRKANKNATFKERKLIAEMEKLCEVESLKNEDLLRKKEEMLDEMRYQQACLRKMKERGRKIRENKMFQRNEGQFYRNLQEMGNKEGEIPSVEEFTEFWGGLWEDGTKTPHKPWMRDVQYELQSKVTDIVDFQIGLAELQRQIRKRKNWTAPGIDGIQNYWWKKLHVTWPVLVKVFGELTHNPNDIPEWFPVGRTVLLPKSNKVDTVSNYRPITCLNTVYKVYTGLIASFMKDHSIRNDLWDDGQLGAMDGVLGTVDQLLVDECIMQQVRESKRNLAVAYYDYKKAYDMVHHDWMIRVYRWMGVPDNVCRVLERLMKLWRTKLEVFVDGQKQTSRWIEILKGFLQGDSYSPVGFCLSEVPIAILIKKSKGYLMGRNDGVEVRRTHSLFIDDLKIYAKSHEELEVMNEIIVLASSDTGALYGVNKCAEVVFKRGKMVKGEGLEVLEERMQALDPETNDFYKFLGCEQASGIDVKKVLKRVTGELNRRLDRVLKTKLSEKNIIKAINSHVLPVVGYIMNVCKISETDLEELDMAVKRKLRNKNFHGRLCSDERLYMDRMVGGRGLKSIKEMYIETKTRIVCYLSLSENFWMNQVWLFWKDKEHWNIKTEVEKAWNEIGERLTLGDDEIRLNGERLEGTWKVVSKKLKRRWKDKKAECRKKELVKKKMQGKGYKNLDKSSHLWLTCNIEPQKVASIIEMQERMIETKAWKRARGIEVDTDMCRLCSKFKESVDHLLAGCEKIAGNEYVKRHNNALMVMAVEWGKEKGLIEEKEKWYELSWKKGTMVENDKAKIVWDFEFKTRKKTRARRPDLILEDKVARKIFIVDMACPMEENIEDKRREKLTKYQQISFETRERRKGYEVRIVPLIIGCLGGGGDRVLKELTTLVNGKSRQILAEMTKVVLWEGESIVRKVLGGLIQE